MKIKNRYNKTDKKGLMIILLICCFVLTLSVGYTALNKELNISGEANLRVKEDVRITNISLYEIKNNGLEDYEPKYTKNTIHNGITLNEALSNVTYKVEITNYSNVLMNLKSLNNINYTNNDITYEINETLPLMLQPLEKKEIEITFKYKNSSLSSNKSLNSAIEFIFVKPESILQVATNGKDTTNFLRSGIKKQEIEEINFANSIEVPKEAIGYFDASEKTDATVIGWYTDMDANGLYEVTIGGTGEVKANQNSSYLFQNLTKLKQINFNDSFNTTNATNMAYMFNNCNALATLDVSKFNTSNTATMQSMFAGCSLLTNLDVSKFNTSNVTSMSSMFNNCSKLTNLDVSNFNTTNTTNMQAMFSGCSKLASLDVSGFDTSNVTVMNGTYQRGMFYNCSSLTNLDVSGFDTSNIKELTGMFYNCSKLTKLDVSGFNTSNVTIMSGRTGGESTGMFYNCKLLTSIDVSGFDTSKVTLMGGTFYGCSSLKSIDLSNWVTSQATNMDTMFRGCSSLVDLKLGNLITSKVTTMSAMFDGCKSLTELDVSSFDTSKVMYMDYMFGSCEKLSYLDLSNFQTPSLKYCNFMFRYDSLLKNLNFKNLSMAQVTNVSQMFAVCPSLEEIDFGNANLINLSNLDTLQMFFMTENNIIVYVKDNENKDVLQAINDKLQVKVI